MLDLGDRRRKLGEDQTGAKHGMSEPLYAQEVDLRTVDNEEGLFFRAIDGALEEAKLKTLGPTAFVTFRHPYSEYKKLGKLCRYWKFPYSYLLRWAVRKLITLLEDPSGELLEVLEKHRAEAIERERRNKQAQARRAGKRKNIDQESMAA